MSQKCGFFNAIKVDDVYDRKYNADAYSDNLAIVISNGVLRSSNDDLKVTSTGLTLNVNVGRGWIKGHWYYNDSLYSFAPVVTPVGGKRYDRVVLRFDNTIVNRKISLVYLTGEESSDPVKPTITRNDDVYDLVLADILSEANKQTLEITDTRDDSELCGWVYSTSGDNSFFVSLDNSFMEWFQEKKDTLSSVTLFKRYVWSKRIETDASTVAFNIPQYDPDTCFIEVYVNGILDRGFSRVNNVITFDGTLIAGTLVTVYAYKSIDGTGIMDVADEITELQNQYATLAGVSNFTYKCTGLNDNISLSQIAQAFHSKSYVPADVTEAANAFLTAIGGNTYLADLSNEAQITINVVGRLGATTPFAGAGTTESRYRWFSFGTAGTTDKRIIFDFSKCEKITIQCAANTNNIIFYGTDLYLKNANVYAYSNGVGCPIIMIAGSANTGRINVDSCRFSISTSGLAVISENGSFINCFGKVVSSNSNAFCFAPKSVSLINVIGGTFYSYIAASGTTPAIFYIYNTETNAVILAHNINCPTVAMTGFSQQYLAVAGAGNIYIDGVCCTMNTSGSYVTVNGQIWKSKR